MKLVMTLLVRDEADIIRENIDYHLSMGVDFIIVTDNCSIDATKYILKEYEAKGKLLYLYEGICDFDQSGWVTKMTRRAVLEYGADWVINNDADEFWWPKNNTNLKEAFLSIPSNYNIVQAERKNFVCLDNIDKSKPFYTQMIFKDLFSLNPIGKPLPPKQAHIGDEKIITNPGNHSVSGIGEQHIIHNLIEIFHFPVRDYQQCELKIIQGGQSYAKNTKVPVTIGNAWRKLYSDYLQDGNLNKYFERVSYNSTKIIDALKSNKIEKDTRLRDYMLKIKV